MSELSIPNRETSLLYPRFAEKVALALAECASLGYRIEVFEAFRSPERQEYLYEQGRTRPGAVVTKARAWQSAHQLGLAVDIAAKDEHGWTWNFPVDKVSAIFIKHGLQPLAMEHVHFQYMNGLDITAAVAMMKVSGLQRVWQEVQAAALRVA